MHHPCHKIAAVISCSFKNNCAVPLRGPYRVVAPNLGISRLVFGTTSDSYRGVAGCLPLRGTLPGALERRYRINEDAVRVVRIFYQIPKVHEAIKISYAVAKSAINS